MAMLAYHRVLHCPISTLILSIHQYETLINFYFEMIMKKILMFIINMCFALKIHHCSPIRGNNMYYHHRISTQKNIERYNHTVMDAPSLPENSTADQSSIHQCYTCHYHKQSDHWHGMVNCDDPFSAEGIPTVSCEGLCAKTRTIIGDGEYMMIRSCLPNCRETQDTTTSVLCCYGNHCNGDVDDSYLLELHVTLWSSAVVLGWILFCACHS